MQLDCRKPRDSVGSTIISDQRTREYHLAVEEKSFITGQSVLYLEL